MPQQSLYSSPCWPAAMPFAALGGCGTSEAAPHAARALPEARRAVPSSSSYSRARAVRPARRPMPISMRIADRRDVLALSFAVTYWDRLGWKDTFGSPRFTARQQDYARAGRGQVATPEFIVNGAIAVVGSNAPAFDAAIAKAGPPRGGPGDRRRRRPASVSERLRPARLRRSGWSATIRERATSRSAPARMAAARCPTATSSANW